MSAFRTNAGPTIETKRCLCASLAYGDFPGVARLYSDHRVRRFLGGVADETFSRDRFETLCSTSHAPIWAVRARADGEFIGMIFLDRHHDGEDMEVSFQFLPECWGRGFATETVGAIIAYARDNLNLTRLVAETQVANTRSRALLERLGMKAIRELPRFGEQQLLYELPIGPFA